MPFPEGFATLYTSDNCVSDLAPLWGRRGRGGTLTVLTCFYMGECTVKVTNLAGRGTATAGQGERCECGQATCAGILHGVSSPLSLSPQV